MTLTFLALLLASPAVLASSPDAIDTSSSRTLAVGDPDIDEAFGGLVVADMNYDCIPDLILLVEETPTYIEGPSLYDGALAIPFTGSGLVAVPADGVGHDDAFLLTSDRGVELISVHPDSFEFQAETLGGSEYANLVGMHIADLDGSGSLDLIGLDSTGLALHVAFDAFQPSVQWTSTTAAGHVTEFTILDWDGDGEIDIALVNAGGLWIRSFVTGALHYVDPTSATDDRLTVVERVGQTDLLVRVAADGGTLFTMDSTGDSSILDLVSHGLARVQSGDLNGDGYGDLICGLTTSNHLLVLEHQGPGEVPYTLAPHGASASDLGRGNLATPDNDALAVAADMDGDGDLDVAVGVEVSQYVRYFENTSNNDAAFYPQPLGARYWWNELDHEAMLLLDIERPVRVDSSWDHVEVTTWLQRAPGLSLVVDDVADFYDIVPMAGDAVTLEVLPSTGIEDGRAHVIELRFVKVDQDGELTDVLPTSKSLFFAMSAWGSFYAAEIGETFIPFVEVPFDSPPTGGWNWGMVADPGGNPQSDPGPGAVLEVDETPCFLDEVSSKTEKTST